MGGWTGGQVDGWTGWMGGRAGGRAGRQADGWMDGGSLVHADLPVTGIVWPQAFLKPRVVPQGKESDVTLLALTF